MGNIRKCPLIYYNMKKCLSWYVLEKFEICCFFSSWRKQSQAIIMCDSKRELLSSPLIKSKSYIRTTWLTKSYIRTTWLTKGYIRTTWLTKSYNRTTCSSDFGPRGLFIRIPWTFSCKTNLRRRQMILFLSMWAYGGCHSLRMWQFRKGRHKNVQIKACTKTEERRVE